METTLPKPTAYQKWLFMQSEGHPVMLANLIVSEVMQQNRAAFAVEAHCIKWYPTDGTIIFGTKKYQSDVIFSVEKQYAKISEVKTFNNLGMAKLLFFLKSISEHPLTLTINEDEIKVEHAVIRF